MYTSKHPILKQSIFNSYAEKINQLDKGIEDFLNAPKNLLIKANFLNKTLPINKIIPIFMSSCFLESISKTVDVYYEKSTSKKSFVLSFEMSSYIDYMLQDLENKSIKDAREYSLSEQFIKNLGYMNMSSTTLQISYDLANVCFSNDYYKNIEGKNIKGNDSENNQEHRIILGFNHIEVSEAALLLEKSYSKVIESSIRKSIFEEFSSDNSLKEMTDIEEFSKDFTHALIKNNLDIKRKPVYYSPQQFSMLIQYCSSLTIDNNKFPSYEALDVLKKFFGDLNYCQNVINNSNNNKI